MILHNKQDTVRSHIFSNVGPVQHLVLGLIGGSSRTLIANSIQPLYSMFRPLNKNNEKLYIL